jgi:hypothetical protein
MMVLVVLDRKDECSCEERTMVKLATMSREGVLHYDDDNDNAPMSYSLVCV